MNVSDYHFILHLVSIIYSAQGSVGSDQSTEYFTISNTEPAGCQHAYICNVMLLTVGRNSNIDMIWLLGCLQHRLYGMLG